jgi:hypothetical protein
MKKGFLQQIWDKYLVAEEEIDAKIAKVRDEAHAKEQELKAQIDILHQMRDERIDKALRIIENDVERALRVRGNLPNDYVFKSYQQSYSVHDRKCVLWYKLRISDSLVASYSVETGLGDRICIRKVPFRLVGSHSLSSGSEPFVSFKQSGKEEWELRTDSLDHLMEILPIFKTLLYDKLKSVAFDELTFAKTLFRHLKNTDRSLYRQGIVLLLCRWRDGEHICVLPKELIQMVCRMAWEK